MQRPIGFALSTILASATAQGRSANFVKAAGVTIPLEGVYWECVSGDPGGATVCGIDTADYNAYRDRHILPRRPVDQITAMEVAGDYWEAYWQKLRCDDFLYPLALVLFDTGVNIGISEAAILLDRALGIPTDAAGVDANAEAAEHQFVVAHGVIALANAEIARRDAYYNEIGAPGKKLNQFLAGWLARDNDIRKAETA